MTRPPFRQGSSGIPALRAHGCALFTCAWLADWATDGNAVPKGQDAIDSVVTRLRKLAGMTTEQFTARGTTLDEAERALEGFPVAGYQPLRMRKLHGGSVKGDLLPELRRGAAALICVNYGVIQDAGRGVGTFRGGHAMAVLNPADGKLDVVDPLRDAVIRLSIDLIEKAMETFGTNPWGGGRGEAGVVVPSMTWKEAFEAATVTIDRLTTQRDDARAQVTLHREERDDARREVEATKALLQECRDATPPDCSAIALERDAAIAARDDAMARLNEETDRAVAAEELVRRVRELVTT